MRVTVHVREKALVVPCGEGTQKVRWLGTVGIARYDPPAGTELGAPRVVRGDAGPLDLNATVHDVLQDGAHVWVTSSADDLQQQSDPAAAAAAPPSAEQQQ